MKTLYISYDGMTDALGQSQVIPYLLELVEEGHEIHILSCEKKQNYNVNREKINDILLQRGIHWHPVMYTKRPPVISTFYDVIKLKRTARILQKQIKFDLVHCRSYIAAIIGVKLKQKFGTKFLFDIRGFWADERVEGGIWNLKNPIYRFIYRFFKRKEKHFYESADAIISLTQKAKVYIDSTFDIKGEIKVIPCAADEVFFSQAKSFKSEIVKKQLGIESKLVLGYLGSIGTWYLLDEMLDFYKVFRRKFENTVFLFITFEDKEIILKKALEREIDLAEIITFSSDRSHIPKYLSVIDYSVFFIKESFSKDASSPTKHGELLSAEIPVIFNNIGDLDRISEEGGGVMVDNFNVSSYKKAIDNLDVYKWNYNDVIKEYYSLKTGAKKYSEVYSYLSRI